MLTKLLWEFGGIRLSHRLYECVECFSKAYTFVVARLLFCQLDDHKLFWRRLLRVPWTARSSNQSILKEISPGCSSEGMMLKLKLQYFGHLMGRVNLLEKTLMLGGIGGRRRRGRPKMRWLDGITDSMDVSEWTPGDGDGHGGLVRCDSWGRRVGHDWVTELNWTTPSWLFG